MRPVMLFLRPAIVLLIVVCSLDAGNQPTDEAKLAARLANQFTNPRRPFEVTHLAFDPAGKHLFASYYLHPQNRPGTDWSAWLVDWDLKTQSSTTLPATYGPFAYSPDGEFRVLGKIDGKRRQGWAGPLATLLVQRRAEGQWTTLNDDADNQVPQPVAGKRDNPSIVAACFLDPQRFVTLDERGGLRLQTVALDKPAREIDPKLEQKILGSPYLRRSHLRFDGKSKTLSLLVLTNSGKQTLEVAWAIDGDDFKRGTTRTLPGSAIPVFSPDGSHSAVISGETISVLDRQGETLHRLDLREALRQKK